MKIEFQNSIVTLNFLCPITGIKKVLGKIPALLLLKLQISCLFDIQAIIHSERRT